MDAQLLVFDLDGTLIDSRADLAESINHMRRCFGLEELSLETISSYVGDGVRKLVERSLQGTGADYAEGLRLNKEYYFSHLTIHTTLYDGVADGLRRLAAAGHALAVLTNKPGDPARKILEHFGLDGLFCTIIGGGDIEVLKPSPDGIFHCMRVAGAAAGSTWMIGDHHADLCAAEKAGVKSAYAAYGFGSPGEYKPDEYFASFAELVGYFG